MKLKGFLGILVCLIVMTGIASATPIALDCSNVPGATSAATVTVTVNQNSLVFSVTPSTASISKIGLPTSLTGITVSDSEGTWVDMGDQNMNNFGTFHEYDKSPVGNTNINQVTVTFTGGLPSSPQFVAHVIRLVIPNSGETSAFFSNCHETQVPEFPTIALPVTAILGIIVIMGRRKQN